MTIQEYVRRCREYRTLHPDEKDNEQPNPARDDEIDEPRITAFVTLFEELLADVPPDILATVDDYYDLTELRVPMRLVGARTRQVFQKAQDAAMRQRYAATGEVHLPELKRYLMTDFKECYRRFGAEMTRAGIEQLLAEFETNPPQE